MLKVVHIALNGLAGSMAHLLHEQAQNFSLLSTFITNQDEYKSENTIVLNDKSLTKWSEHSAHSKKQLAEISAPQLLEVFQQKEFLEADIVHLHGLSETVSPLLLPFLARKPLVWTLYDCRAYTGGCQHSAHCQNWRDKECGDCPIDQRKKTETQHRAAYRLKREIYQSMSAQVVCTSEWQLAQVKKSILSDQPSMKILPAVDTQVFQPGDKQWAREELGLPQDAFIFLYYCSNGVFEAGGPYLKEALKLMKNKANKVILLCIGDEGASYFSGLNIEVQSVVGHQTPAQMANYFRAGDVLIYSQVLAQTFLPVLQAGACATPTIAFNVAGVQEVIEHRKSGYIAESQKSQSLADGLSWAIQKGKHGMITCGQNAAKHCGKQVRAKAIMAEYDQLYRKIGPKRLAQISTVLADSDKYAQIKQWAIECAEQAWRITPDWARVWNSLDAELEQFSEKNQFRGVFIDAFYRQCLRYVEFETDKNEIWNFVAEWLNRRKVEYRCGNLPAEEQKAQAEFCRDLREFLVKYFTSTPLAQFAAIKPFSNEIMTRLWRYIYINDLSSLNLSMEKTELDSALLDTEEGKSGYPRLFLHSLYEPHAETDFQLPVERLMKTRLPLVMKVLTLLWLTNAPLYNGTVKNQQVALKIIHDFCTLFSKQETSRQLPEPFIALFIESFVSSLWRCSYIGGNNLMTLSAFGDFIRATMLNKYGKYELEAANKKRKPHKKLRIGYLSTNFRTQAVSFYMANRIFLHDKENFEVYTFILRRFEDDVTEKIRKASDKVFEYEKFSNLEPIIQDLVASDLDVLIYADIGMDPFTYQLGSIRLAPVQAVLVGHGVTTGLEMIDYYISGDFEPENAQQHYREHLLPLPNLGAAQIPPKVNKHGMTRQSIGVPNQAVVLMSFANGIKFHRDRDNMFVEILKRAPEAYIVLKPFQNPDSIDFHLNERIQTAAKAAGVEKRLIVLPPLGNPADLWGLLTLADIQLDTYPYGGWTTNMEALYAGLPIVTQEGDMARSRWGAAMLRSLGIQEGIAYNEEEYIQWAVKLAKSKELRDQVAERIQAKAKDVLFNGPKAQGDYEKVLKEIAGKRQK